MEDSSSEETEKDQEPPTILQTRKSDLSILNLPPAAYPSSTIPKSATEKAPENMYFLDNFKGSSRLGAKNCMYCILMVGKYHDVRYLKYRLWGPFHHAYHARPFDGSPLKLGVIVYYVPKRTMRVIARRATMLAGDRSRDESEARLDLRALSRVS